jgi:PST family polysaccharide transporter
MFRWGVVWSVGVILAFVLGLSWGVHGIAAAYAVCNVLIAVPALRASGRLIGVSIGDVGRALGRVGLASLAMGVVVWLVEASIPSGWGPPGQLVSGVLAGVGAYLVILQIVSPQPYDDLKRLIADVRGR